MVPEVQPAHKDLELRCCPEPVVLRAEDGAAVPPRVTGYAVVFDQRSVPFGGAVEIVARGAFKEALAAGPDIRLLINHRGLPLARTRSGTLSLTEDEHGLAFSAELDRTDPDVQRLLPKLRRGDLSQCSFAFRILKDGETWAQDGKLILRTLTALELFEISLVTFPAYPSTTVALRNLPALFVAKPTGQLTGHQNLARARTGLARARCHQE